MAPVSRGPVRWKPGAAARGDEQVHGGGSGSSCLSSKWCAACTLPLALVLLAATQLGSLEVQLPHVGNTGRVSLTLQWQLLQSGSGRLASGAASLLPSAWRAGGCTLTPESVPKVGLFLFVTDKGAHIFRPCIAGHWMIASSRVPAFLCRRMVGHSSAKSGAAAAASASAHIRSDRQHQQQQTAAAAAATAAAKRGCLSR